MLRRGGADGRKSRSSFGNTALERLLVNLSFDRRPNTGIPWGWRRYLHYNTPSVRFTWPGVSPSGQESFVMDKHAASSANSPAKHPHPKREKS